MIQTLQSQSVVGGAEQFDGTANRGLFLFPFTNLEQGKNIYVDRIGIYGPSTTATWLEVWWEYASGFGAQRILIGTADAAAMASPNGDLAVTFCPGRVPRNFDGTFWSLIVLSSGLVGAAQANVGIARDA
jgi:hypothetical protein